MPTATALISSPAALSATAGDHAHQPAVAVHHGRRADPVLVEEVEDFLEARVLVDQDEVTGHDVLELGEAVVACRVALGEDAGGPVLRIRDDQHPVGPLVDQVECRPDRLGGAQRDRRLEDGVTGLLVAQVLGDHVERDVLRQDRETAAPGDGLGHAPTGYRRHVRDHHRDRRAQAVGRGQVHVQARRHVGQAGHHEHVRVREVVLGEDVVDEAHGSGRPPGGPNGAPES
jgi:hypothetical protein